MTTLRSNARPGSAADGLAIRALRRSARNGGRTIKPKRAWDGVHAKTVASFVPKLTEKAFQTFGFSTASLIMEWSHVVGDDLAGFCQPERLVWPRRNSVVDADGEQLVAPRGATLTLRADPARALDIQYKLQLLGERINRYFGYRAIEQIKLVQGPLTFRLPPSADAPLLAHKPAQAEPSPVAVDANIDPRLRGALEAMANGIARTRSRRKVALAG